MLGLRSFFTFRLCYLLSLNYVIWSLHPSILTVCFNLQLYPVTFWSCWGWGSVWVLAKFCPLQKVYKVFKFQGSPDGKAKWSSMQLFLARFLETHWHPNSFSCQTEKQNNLHRCCRYVPSKEIASENHRDAMTTWWSWWPFGLSGDEANCHIAADMQTWFKKQPIWWEKTWKNSVLVFSFHFSVRCFLMSFFVEVKSWNSKMMHWRYPLLSCSMLNGRSWMT